MNKHLQAILFGRFYNEGYAYYMTLAEQGIFEGSSLAAFIAREKECPYPDTSQRGIAWLAGYRVGTPLVTGDGIVGAGILVQKPGDPGQVLCVSRGVFPGRRGFKWALVGGSLDRGESPQACAIRETFEETGINLTERDLGPAGLPRLRGSPQSGP